MMNRDPSHPPFEAKRSALVLIDMVNHQIHGLDDLLARQGLDGRYFQRRLRDVTIPNLMALAAAARTNGSRVVHVRMGSVHDDFADVVPTYREGLRALDARDGRWACEVIDELAPAAGDVSLVKSGSGAFSSSALDGVLRNMGIEHVIYTGVVTPGCVLVTALVGNDLGYRGYVAADATACFSDADQLAAEAVLSQGYARVLPTAACLDLLSG